MHDRTIAARIVASFGDRETNRAPARTSSGIAGRRSIQDLRAKLEKLLLEAEDCELTSLLATDIKERKFFTKLAVYLKAIAEVIEQTIAEGKKSDDARVARPDKGVSP